MSEYFNLFELCKGNLMPDRFCIEKFISHKASWGFYLDSIHYSVYC